MALDSQKLVGLGESVARKFLMKHGFSVLERKYTKKWGEIDIIAKKDEKFHFIEVKSKEVESMDPNILEMLKPEENIHLWKIQKLRRVVETYLISKRLGSVSWEFNLIIVYLDTNKRMAKVKMVNNTVL